MFSHPQGRSLLRLVTAGGVSAAALAFASPAGAAIGQAPAPDFSDRPNLVSVAANASNTVVTYTFDKAIEAGTLSPGDFILGGYRSDAAAAAPDAANRNVSNTRQVITRYDSTDLDAGSTTFATVADAAVTGDLSGVDNVEDAARLFGDSETGTRGFTPGPDLQRVIPDPNNNEILRYEFDQDIEDAPSNNAIGYYDSAGNPVIPAGITIDGDSDNVLVADFGASAATARVGFANDNGGIQIVTAGQQSAVAPPFLSVQIAGRGTSIGVPRLLTAEFTDIETVIATFDRPVQNPNAGSFDFVNSSGNAAHQADLAVGVVNNSRAVRLTFDAPARDEVESFVQLVANAGAVEDAANVPNVLNGVPTGGNFGADSSGYTTAPDPLSATYNRANGRLTVRWDSRIESVDPAGFVLLDSAGDPLATTGTATADGIGTQPNQGETRAEFVADLDGVAAVRLLGNGLPLQAGDLFTTAGTYAVRGTGNNVGVDAQNVEQVVAVNVVG